MPRLQCGWSTFRFVPRIDAGADWRCLDWLGVVVVLWSE